MQQNKHNKALVNNTGEMHAYETHIDNNISANKTNGMHNTCDMQGS